MRRCTDRLHLVAGPHRSPAVEGGPVSRPARGDLSRRHYLHAIFMERDSILGIKEPLMTVQGPLIDDHQALL